MFPKEVRNFLGETYFFASLHPVLIFELLPIGAGPTVKAALQIINFLHDSSLLFLEVLEDVLHADEVYRVYFLFVNVDFQFVQTVYSDDEAVFVGEHVLVVIF